MHNTPYEKKKMGEIAIRKIDQTLVKIFFLSLLSILLLLICYTSVASADTLTVDDDEPADYKEIQDAVDAAQENDSILVKNGIYYENIVVNKSLILLGETPSLTIVDGGGGSRGFSVTSNDTCIENFSVTNATDGILIRKANNCSLQNIHCFKLDFEGIFLDSSSATSLKNVTTVQCRTGIMLYFSSGNSISQLKSHNNTDYNLNLYSANNNSLTQCDLSNSTIGLIAAYADNNSFERLSSSFSNFYGAYFSASSNNSITNASFSQNKKSDISLDYSSVNEAINLSNLNLTLSLSRGSKFFIYNFLDLEVLSDHDFGVENTDVFFASNETVFFKSHGYGGNDSKTNRNGKIRSIKALYSVVTEDGSAFFEGTLHIKKSNWTFSKNENLSEPHKILVKNKAPVIGNISRFPLHGDHKTEFTFSVNCTDPTLQNVFLKIDNKTFVLENSNSSFYSKTLFFAAGNYTYSIIASDGLDTTESSFRNFVVNDTIPPNKIKNLTIEDLGDGSFRLVWMESPDHDFYFYSIYFSSRDFNSTMNLEPYTKIFERNISSAIIEALTPNLPFFFAITATDIIGNENSTVKPIKSISKKVIISVFEINITSFNVDPNKIEIGKSITISFRLKNKGNKTIENLSTTIKLNQTSIFNKAYYNISLNENISESLSFEVKKAGVFTLSLEIKYNNETKAESQEIVVTADAKSKERKEELKEANYIVLGILIIFVVGFLFFLLLKKRGIEEKKKVFEQGESKDVEEKNKQI